ncbi:MAG: ABC transporter ATP-binding protein [Parcubacteria group bacterium]|nr:ABC transporter ATP-binding protein [Parcubacteria group bacterium]
MGDYEHSRGDLLLEAVGVTKSFGDRTILKGLSVQVHDVIRPGMTQGQIVAILGPSGCGKTTLFRALAGLERPNEGIVRAGSPLVPVVAGSVGVVYQNYMLLVHRTVMGNMLVSARNNPEISATDYKSRIMELLERFGIAREIDKYPIQLSGGQRQRLAIAQQVINGDKLIMMDEPFSGLDTLAKTAVCDLLVETTNMDEHRTIVVISHDIRSALRIADTVWLMGRDFVDGVPQDGARIVEEINLMDSIAWRPDNHRLPEFERLVRRIEDRYPEL